MEFDGDNLRRLLGKYKFRDLTLEELKNVNMAYPNFRFSMDTYGNTYYMPIRFWILDSHPFAPPICFLKPTPNMGISVGKHVDAQGRIYLPYLQNWSHPKSVLLGLISEMIAKFQEELPLYSVTSSSESQRAELLAYIAKITQGVSDINSKSRENEEKKINKITVVGGGELGVACVLAIAAKGVADKVVLLDLSDGGIKGGAMDLDIFGLPNVEISKDPSASAHSQVVVLTVNSLGNSQSYLDAIQANVDLFRGLVPALGHFSQQSVLLVASQPVEIMAYVAWKLSSFPENQVIGIGCNLDSERFRYIVANVLKAQTPGKGVWIIGEQGNDKVPAWGGPEEIVPNSSQLQLANRAVEILTTKGQRSWSVGLSVADLTDSIVNNKRKVHSVSILAKGSYNIDSEVFLSLPCILGNGGVTEVMETTLKDDRLLKKLQSSAASLRDLQRQLKI
uniref:UEV and lactate/malate dehyrogenase domains n=1 Tax=Ornithorhynchus anatinus TaxID=9258 RepID=A0A6I8NW91_ORNAN